MTDLLRQEIAALSHAIVVKVGTRVLTGADGTLDEGRIATLAEEISAIVDGGRKVLLVSSGAVGAGLGRLGLSQRPAGLAQLQAVAAVGQSALIEAYDRTFRRHGRHAAQVLLTAGDLDDRARYLNVRNTLLALLDMGAVPVINENDTVAVDELAATFGDNDRLAAMVANLLRAPLLVMLSDVDGLFDGDPAETGSRLIPTVTHLDDSIFALARAPIRTAAGGISKGGMASKLAAARMVTAAGENAIIASGRTPGVLAKIVAGEVVGTLIIAQGKTISPLKRWIGYSAQPRGRLIVDDGARRAIAAKGRSLLAIGVTRVEGAFQKGDVISVVAGGAEIARGLSNYAAEEIERIKGLRSDRIEQVLGHRPYEEVVHRDNMAVTTT